MEVTLYRLAFACYIYTKFTNYDKTYSEFLSKTSPRIDMRNESHRGALLEWLNDWQCRQFEIKYHSFASSNLFFWYERNEKLIPNEDKTILKISEDELQITGQIYRSLKDVKATEFKTVGPTGTAKILFALRKDLFLPWDIRIRAKLGYNGDSMSYVSFLKDTQRLLHLLTTECEKYNINILELPKLLGRELSSLTKLMDEYNWVTLTNSFEPPSIHDVKKWLRWAESS